MKLVRGTWVRTRTIFLLPSTLVAILTFILLRAPPVPRVSRYSTSAPVHRHRNGNRNRKNIDDATCDDACCARRYGSPLQKVVPVWVPAIPSDRSGDGKNNGLGTDARMAVYSHGDIVSHNIRLNGGGWESQRTREILKSLGRWSRSKKIDNYYSGRYAWRRKGYARKSPSYLTH